MENIAYINQCGYWRIWKSRVL